jgi:TolA-binding protein
VDRTQAPAAGVDAGKAVATVDVNALPTQGGGGGGGGDARGLLQQADAAKTRGDLDKAKQLYGQALAKEPTSSEALGGLGDVARAQRDYANAQTYYKRAIAENGMFISAHVGLGDVLWESGDRAGAQKIYKEVVERFPLGTYPAYAKQRAETAAAPPTPTTTAAPPAASASAEPTNPEAP